MNEAAARKTALVTGASRGIGAAIFAALGQAGYHAIGTATQEAGVQAIEKAGSKHGGRGMLYNAADETQAASFAEKVCAANSGVDVLVLNAAINADTLLMRMKRESWDGVMTVNLTAAFLLSQAAIRAMVKKRWGRVIFISSVVASLGNPGQANYCAAKAGIEGYCRAVAREVAGRGITVNAVAPGFIETDMTNNLPEAARKHFMDNIPAGRAGQPQDVANAVLYLASDGAEYITGQVLHVNGGLYMG